jgi:hypothetical protein
MGLLFLSSAACYLKRFLEQQLTSTVGSSQALNIHCAVRAPTTHLYLIDIAVRASQHALFLDDTLLYCNPTQHAKASCESPKRLLKSDVHLKAVFFNDGHRRVG